MPSGDRTGPMGLGPMTGRSSGFCAGYDTPGYDLLQIKIVEKQKL